MEGLTVNEKDHIIHVLEFKREVRGLCLGNNSLLKTRVPRMTKYLEDPVWGRVQGEIVMRENERIQFELHKSMMKDTMTTVLVIQK